MAQKIITIYTDDLTGKQADDVATHTFALEGVAYEIDLGSDSYDELLEKLGPYLGAGRKTGGRAKRGTAAKTRPASDETAKVRAWARDKGYEINDRGRVPAHIREAYDKAN